MAATAVITKVGKRVHLARVGTSKTLCGRQVWVEIRAGYAGWIFEENGCAACTAAVAKGDRR